MSIVLAELVESGGAAIAAWHQAVSLIDSDPRSAMKQLSQAEIRLETFIRLERVDSLRVTRECIKLLDSELVGSEVEDDAAAGPQGSIVSATD